MLFVLLGLLPSRHGHAVLLGKLLVLLQVSLGMLPSLLRDLAARLAPGAATVLLGQKRTQSSREDAAAHADNAGSVGKLAVAAFLLSHFAQNATVHLLGAATLFHAANVLDAITLLIGFLHVAVNKAVGGDSLATALALLAVSTATAHLAFRLGVNLAALLVGAAADRPHASLNIGVQRIVDFPPRSINRTLQRGGHASDLVVHGLLGLLAIFHARLLGV